MQYDIFISYRRKDVGEKAEHLKDLLEPRYKGRISFDLENLSGVFDVNLIKRIDNCKDFLLVLGKTSLVYNEDDYRPEIVDLYNYLGSCTQKEFEQKILENNSHLDFVRIEISRALHRKGLNIIPIVPESTDQYAFGNLKLPPDIVGVKRYFCNVTFSDNPDTLFKDIIPKITKQLKSKPDSYLLKIIFFCFAFIVILACVLWGYSKYKQKLQMEITRSELMANDINNFVLEWNPETSLHQAEAINDILNMMEPVEGGTFMMGADKNDTDECFETPPVKQDVKSFFMGRYEVTTSQWCKIYGVPFMEEIANYPISNVSFDECIDFCERLHNLTGLYFDLPTEAEWEFAARGGIEPDNTIYSGRNDPDEAAWYIGNSHNKVHECNAELYCNSLNLFDMSGNVSEWCLWTDSTHRLYCDMIENKVSEDVIYNKGVNIIRGGNYLSEPYQLTVFHREASDRLQKSPNIGLRLIIRK